ncbi:type IV pilus modification protein PilV [Alkalimonas collagenimarina]|uniref:Type IV pilus modification protein PilV n=1 Tax=Alkalimonas collagenimarina TaxID=400390 RepID=A0ABT9H0K3_9GAMM|nr:type IV pilus modification protein PilV [Alkalimonas collagenimarina]MDP4536856.1 type IV pilus modification protein PilV [Alkalimonas collagenimarina]
MKQWQSSFQSQRGVSLLEVLIAMLVLGIGLLGVAALQANSVRNTQGAYERTMAVVMVDSIIESIRANPNAAPGAYALSGCTAGGSGLVGEQLSHWVGRLQLELGDDVDCSISFSGGLYVIEVQWQDTRLSEMADSAIRTAVML